MALTSYLVRENGDHVIISIPVSNSGASTTGSVSVVLSAFTNLTFVEAFPEAGTFNSGTRTWSGFTIPVGQSRTLDLEFSVANVTLMPTTITGTISGARAVDGNDGVGTAISVEINVEDTGVGLTGATGPTGYTGYTLSLNHI